MLADSVIGLNSPEPVIYADQEMGLSSPSRAAQHDRELVLSLKSCPNLTLDTTMTRALSDDGADSRDSWTQTSSEMDLEDTNPLVSGHNAMHFTHAARLQNAGPLCREYEKMISGQPYVVSPWADPSPSLQGRKLRARQFCASYNQDDIPNDPKMPPEKVFQGLRNRREKMLRTIIGEIGEQPVIEPPFNFQYGSNISLGDRFYANVNLRIHDSGFVTIGNRVLIAPNVTIVTETHDKDIQSRRDGVVFARPVTIGDDCWIGSGATILPGVTIGKGTTIGAGSMVTKDIPPFSVAWGVPARVIHSVDDPDAADSAQYKAAQHL
ncbi:conserved hypothetical protein [Paecilomyces variotii No. 5]|uniref:Maltose/galactoside acetyltransferase domain-containing protein n=1 Tax=Byssochlamys spectabilis (strain No. 5 / NBRC 109023) TaxID=1356009 RepID=V5FH81_BYSSN|nr:conserved hypothetical protein [Paecilomyces variotii No. 5]